MKNNNWFSIKRVHPRVYALAEFCHWEKVVSYLFLGNTEGVLIDSGMGYRNIGEAVKELTNLPVKVVLTHAHWDHIGGVGSFEEVIVFDNRFERRLLESGFEAERVEQLNNPDLFKKPFKPKRYKVTGKKEYGLLHDTDVVEAGGYEMRAIHTPGHTPGSVCYWVPKLDILFVGDCFYPGPIYVQLAESNFNDYLKSMLRLKRLVSGETRLFPGHNATFVDVSLLNRVVEASSKISKKLEAITGETDKGLVEYQFDGFSILVKA